MEDFEKKEDVEDIEETKTDEDQAKDSAEDSTEEAEKKYTDDDVNRIVARRVAAERKRLNKLLGEEQQVSELEERERNVRKREQMADIKDKLIKSGNPTCLAEILDYSSEESINESYEKVTGIFEQAMTEKAKKVFAGRTPSAHDHLNTADPIARAFAPSARY